MESKIDKIFHHIAFTLFWLGVAMVIVSFLIRINQWEDNKINTCIDKGYSYTQCTEL